MGEAKYNEPWEARHYGPTDVAIRDKNGDVRAWVGANAARPGQDADRIVACVNALSGITNVEALGALLTLAQEVADESHLVCVGPSCFHLECRMKFALDALYAPQASEATPL